MLKRLLLSLLAVAGILGAAHAVNITGTTTLSTNSVDSVGFTQLSVTNAITAFAGGGQTSAVQLNSAYNRVTVVGTAADSVKLPFCGVNTSPNGAALGPGTQVWVMNTSGNSLNVFPNTGDAINALSANTAIAIATVTGKVFTCAVAGTWQSLNYATF
jgi:hypothetical protein